MNPQSNILETIVAKRRIDVADLKEKSTIKGLESSIFYGTPSVSLRKYILRPDMTGIVAEFKRRSPTKGVFNAYASVEKVTIGYMQAGASALSILTEPSFFGGKNQDLVTARQTNFCPILRKDFIVDEWQVIETKSIGADVLLLIASILTVQECQNLAKLAKEIGLEVLLEVHNKEELDRYLNPHIDLVGVNNRDLKTFSVNIENSLALADAIPANLVKISESGLDTSAELEVLSKAGYQGFLMGERFMKSSHPERQADLFMKDWMKAKQKLNGRI